jgi:hypothetical protein
MAVSKGYMKDVESTSHYVGHMGTGIVVQKDDIQ